MGKIGKLLVILVALAAPRSGAAYQGNVYDCRPSQGDWYTCTGEQGQSLDCVNIGGASGWFCVSHDGWRDPVN